MGKVGGSYSLLKKNEKAHVAYIYQVYKHSYFREKRRAKKIKKLTIKN